MRLLLALAILVAIGAGALYFRYGTVAPCGILRERDREHAAARRGLSAALAAALPDQAVDALLAAQYRPLTPQRCVAVLVGADGRGRRGPHIAQRRGRHRSNFFSPPWGGDGRVR